MDRRTFLAFSTIGAGLFSGCNELLGPGTEQTPRGPADSTPTDERSTETTPEQRTYDRQYPVLEGTAFDVGAVYHPELGGDSWGCIAGEPGVGGYGSPPTEEVLAWQLDHAQGFGIDRWIVPAEQRGRLHRIADHPLADRFALELSYNPREALVGSASLRSQLDAIRQTIERTPVYATRDGRPVVTVGSGAELLVEHDRSRGGVYPHPAVRESFDAPEEFGRTIREELRLDDGTEPYLVAKLGVVLHNLSPVTDDFRRFATQFDAMYDRPSGPGRGEPSWQEATRWNVNKFLAEWRLATHLGIDFEPMVFPGWVPQTNTCEGSDGHVPRTPEHFADLLDLATPLTSGRIRIASFNNWHSGTQIEPGQVRGDDYGTTYLETVRSVQAGEPADRTVYYVGPDGSNANPGSEREPLRTIQRALLRAEPGDTVHVLAGEYDEHVETVRAGEPDRPITITGPPDAVLRGDPDRSLIVRIRHSHVHITGLTIDGLQDPTAPDDAAAYNRGQLVIARPPTTTDAYLEDVVIAPHTMGNTGREMVSLERTQGAEVGPFRVIGPAGTHYLRTDRPGHNGEIVYLGTSPGNLGSNWHPWTEYDRTNDVLVHHIDNSEGHGHSELVQMKPGTHDVTIEYCTDGGGSRNTEDYSSASVRFNSFGGTLRWCDLRDGHGNGVEIGSRIAAEAQEEKTDLTEFERRGGTDNAVYGNRITGYGNKALVFTIDSQTQADQDHVCNNEYDGRTDGDPDASCPESVPDGDGVGHTGGDSPWA